MGVWGEDLLFICAGTEMQFSTFEDSEHETLIIRFPRTCILFEKRIATGF